MSNKPKPAQPAARQGQPAAARPGQPTVRPAVAGQPTVRPAVGQVAARPAGSPAAATAAQKRPLSTAPVVPAKRATTGVQTLVVYCKAANDEIGIETLVGDYTEAGTNHGKKYFKRVPPSGGEGDATVFLYFWDDRDGPNFGGWWFGDQVGGSQVWSRCENDGPLPPRSGWRIPWDGPVQADLAVEPKQPARASAPAKPESKPETEESLAAAAASQEEVDERVQRATDGVVITEIEATQAIESVQAMLQGDVSDEGLRIVDEMLRTQSQSLLEAHKTLAADIMDARRTAPKGAPALSLLAPRLRTVQASLAQEMKQVRELTAKNKQEAEQRKLKAKAEEQQMQAEHRDAKLLEEALPGAMEAVTNAEDLIDAVITAASPLAVELSEEMTDSVNATIRATEAAAIKARDGIKTARLHLNLKVTAAKNFALEARKVALTEYTALQEKLNEAQKRLGPYVQFRKEYERKFEEKQVMTKVASKLGAAEVEVEKVLNSLSGSPAEEQVRATDASIPGVLSSLTSVLKFVEQRILSAQGALKDDLSQMQERGKESKRKLESFRAELQGQLEQIQVRSVLQQGLDKTEAAEEALAQTTIAETPFLKGEELLPAAEASEAIAACRESAVAADAKVSQARTFLKSRIMDVRRLPEKARASTTEELTQLTNRVEAAGQKLAVFKRETAARETVMLLQEATLKVADAEAKVQKVLACAEPLATENLEDITCEKLKEATEQTMEAEKHAALACGEARKTLMAKQRDAQGRDAATFGAELTKLQTRLAAALQEVGKQRKVAVLGEKLWKGKLLAQEKEEVLAQVEADVEKMELLTTPLGDEKPSNESVKELDASATAALKSLSELMKALEPVHASAQAGLKDHLGKMLARGKKAQQKLEEVREATKEQRESVTCEALVEEARAKLAKVEEAFKQVASAELPYLMGMEVLPIDEASKAVAESEAATQAVQQAINEAKAFLTLKVPEIRCFAEAVSKGGQQEMMACNKQIESAVERLNDFKQETEGRKRIALRQEALAKVAEAEEAVQKTIAAAAPLVSQSVNEVSPEMAADICEKLGETERAAQQKLDAARQYLMERQKDKKVPMDAVDVSKLVSRLNAVQVELGKAKATASEHEQRFVARLLQQEANDLLQKLEAELEVATEAAAPLLVEGGRTFVVASMTKMILEALNEHVHKKGTTRDELFNSISATAVAEAKVSQEDFSTFLEKVPELCSRPDLAFSAEQRSAIFEQVDTGKTGVISKAAFEQLFRERYICINSVSITDCFDISTSKTVDKLEADDVVEALSEPRTHETLGMMRIEVKVLKDGTSGWVSMQGNQGTAYLTPFTAYAAFMKGLDKTLASATAAGGKAQKFIAAKGTELRDCKQGPLAEVKGELLKVRPKIVALQGRVDQLKKKVEDGKREHSRREEFERKKQEEKKDRKAAAVVLKAIAEKVQSAEAALAPLEQAAVPFRPAGEEGLAPVAEPLAVRKAVLAAAEELSKAVSTAQESLSSSQGLDHVAKAAKGPWFEARREMAKSQQQLEELQGKAKSIVEAMQAAFDILVASTQGQVSDALRASIQARGTSIDALFMELAGSSRDHISEAALGAHLDGLQGLSLTAEQKRLLLDQGDSAQLSRRRFFKMLERFYKCVKDIAITSEFDIKSSSNVRKLEVGELLEVLEGPKGDETLGVTRVRARALSDGKTGWITGKGNQGTPFLEETSKPFYAVVEPVALQEGFPSEGSKELRVLKADEVIEVLEGPRKEVVGNAVRARGKAASDGATGWFTVKSRQGDVVSQPGKSTFRCTQGIALTDGPNIKECKVLRKLDKGEVVLALDDPVSDELAGVMRVKARALKDNMEGWLTTRGNAGSTYAEEAGRHYVVARTTPLQSTFASEGKTMRVLAEGESIELLEGPREERSEPAVRLRGRAVADGSVGWVTLKNANLRPWTPEDDEPGPSA